MEGWYEFDRNGLKSVILSLPLLNLILITKSDKYFADSIFSC